MEIEDSLRIKEFFDPDADYADLINDMEFCKIEILVKHRDELVGYLVCTLFYDDIIEENGKDLVTVADDDTTQDTYEAMEVLRKRVDKQTDKDADSNMFLLAPSTVYIENIAVKDDYRCKGIGNWLLRNLPQIIAKRYQRDLITIVIKLFPEYINWDITPPDFTPFRFAGRDLATITPDEFDENDEYDETDPMFIKMKSLLENNGYSRYENTLYFFRDFFKE